MTSSLHSESVFTGSIFVTATDTDAGKSHVTAALCRALLADGVDVRALKPVACGSEPGELNGDIAALLAAQSMRPERAGEINLYDFAAYAAPMFAARAEGAVVDADALLDWCRKCAAEHALSLLEGVGGLMVPLAEGFSVHDWLQHMPAARVLLVVRVRLGGINQALLTLEALRHMGRSPDWVVLNAADAGVTEAMFDEHAEAMMPWIEPGMLLCRLPFLPDPAQAARHLHGSGLIEALAA